MSEACFKTDLMREQRKKWTLGNDVHVLNQLEAFSQCLVSRTNSFLNYLEDFEKDLKTARLGVKIVSNSFEAVSDTQFVESRVYDEEEDVFSPIYQVSKIDDPTNNKLTNNVNLKLEEALRTCSKILESKFEAVNIPLSDSEDDGDISFSNELIFIPKNKYKLRPLPHIIGGEDFHKDDSLGLVIGRSSIERLNDNIMNGNETISQSDSSSVDEPDESSATQELHFGKAYDINSLSDSKDNNTDLLNNSSEDLWKDSSSQTIREIIPEKEVETIVTSEKSDLIYPDHTSRGVNLKSSIHDELKQLFSSELIAEKKPKLKVLMKTQEAYNNQPSSSPELVKPQVPSPTFSDKELVISDDKSNAQEDAVIRCSPKPILFDNSLQNTPFCEKRIGLLHQKVNKISLSDEKPILPVVIDDGLLPNVPTEILHSFAKERAKIRGKRRLPSRKPRVVTSDNEEPYNHYSGKENPVLSPSTDEEDLFVLPDSQVEKNSPASSLFMSSSLFSPGSSIEGKKISMFEGNEKEEEDLKQATNEGIFDEPLGVAKEPLVETFNGGRNKNLFNDWNPFDPEERMLFQSVDKKSRKSKLFDDLLDNSESSSKISDDDLFSENSVFSKSSSLFESNSSTMSSSSNRLNSKTLAFNKSEVPKLFSDESEDENDVDENIFSERGSYESPFLLSFDKRKNNMKSSNQFGQRNNEEKKNVGEAFYSNPLSDSEDNLFD